MRHLMRNVAAHDTRGHRNALVRLLRRTIQFSYNNLGAQLPAPPIARFRCFTFARNDCNKYESYVMRERERSKYAIKPTVLVSATSVPDASFAACFMTQHQYAKSVSIVTDIHAHIHTHVYAFPLIITEKSACHTASDSSKIDRVHIARELPRSQSSMTTRPAGKRSPLSLFFFENRRSRCKSRRVIAPRSMVIFITN